MVTMLMAVVLGTLGHSLAKRAEDDRTKFRRQAIWFTVSSCSSFPAFPGPSAQDSKPTVGGETFPFPSLCLVTRSCSGLRQQHAPDAAGRTAGVTRCRARALYIRKCSLCHGERWTLMASKSPDLSTSILSLEERVALITYGKGTMPGQKGILNRAEIEAVAQIH